MISRDSLRSRQSHRAPSRSHNLIDFIPFADAYAARLSAPLKANPGEKGFIISYVISNWFPIIAASLGPIANLNSIVALVDKWRLPADQVTAEDESSLGNSKRPADLKWIIALNSISLFCGCIANISLFLNFAKRIRYTISQAVSIGGWYLASLILLSLIVASRFVYFNTDKYQHSQGYWHAVITCILYFVSATLLLINEIGHLMGEYEASFNLTMRQRSIMIQNVALIIWIGAGAVLFNNIMHIPYADGIYYCVVTILTIGLGDITPKSVLGRALCLPYAFVGVINLGLIIATIRQIVLEAGGQTVKLHRSELTRSKKLAELELLDPAELQQREPHIFEAMRNVHLKVVRNSRYYSVCVSLCSFVSFLLLGAMVFYFCEDNWTYFEAVYFCSLCLLTIGYGDFSPQSTAGRPFFVVWSLGAVPLMTILISNLGDTLFKALLEGGNVIGNWFLKSKSDDDGTGKLDSVTRRGRLSESSSIFADPKFSDLRDVIGGGEGPDCQPSSDDPSPRDATSNTKSDVIARRIIHLCREMRMVVNHLISEPDKVYEYEEWRRLYDMTVENEGVRESIEGSASDNDDDDDGNGNGGRHSHPHHPLYWLTEESPIRFPIAECQYFLENYFNALEDEIIDLVKSSYDAKQKDE